MREVSEAAQDLPQETIEVHTRLLKCALELEESRDFWAHADQPVDPKRAFEDYWFGARSYAYVQVLLTNFRARFVAFPDALRTLHRWRLMSPDTRAILCHWHMQLSDPLYRSFTGDFLVERRQEGRAEISRDRVVAWVSDQGPGRWTMVTRIQFASKLLSVAYSAGLIASNRDPRPIVLPRVPDDALVYGLYLLRETRFAGTLLENPYFISVGLSGEGLEDRLRGLPGLQFGRQGDIFDFGWKFPGLWAWAQATLPESR